MSNIHHDQSLWTRLNALKVKSQDTKSSLSDLQSRFHALKGKQRKPNNESNDNLSNNIDHTLEAAEDFGSNHLLNQPYEEYEDVDQLLKDLGSEGLFDYGQDDQNPEKLLFEARKSLEHAEQDLPDPVKQDDGENAKQGDGNEMDSDKNDASDQDDGTRSDAGDSVKAAEYLEQVLAELSIEEKEPYSRNEDQVLGTIDDLKNLSTPSKEMETSTITDDSAFESRLAALLKSHGNPSKELDTPPVSDTDPTEDWCIICYDDATVQCVGCDGDLYCTKCWKEGHVGPDVGRDERSHRALAYDKKDKKRSNEPQKKLLAA